MALAMKGVQMAKQANFAPAALQHFNYSTEVRRPRAMNTAAMKRGRGGRSSFSGDVVTVFGANGFIGRSVTNRLGKNGSQMIFPYRGEHYKMMRLKCVGDLGQVLFTPLELKDEDSIRRAVAHSNIVINLLGRTWETRNYSFEDVNITGPQRIAKVCKEMGVQRLVHMSHVNAREEPEVAFLKGGSRFLSTKYQGELAVKSEFPEATIFRCSDVYGEGDSFVNYWFSKWRKPKATGPYLSLFGRGELTMKQPIFHSDLATGIMNSLHDPEAVGQTYEAMGPQRLTQHDLITYMYDCATRNKELGNFGIKELMLDPKTLLKSAIFERFPLFGMNNVLHGNTLDRLERDAISDTSDGYPDMASALGVKLTILEDKMPFACSMYDQYAYYHYETVEEKPVPKPPQLVSLSDERAARQRRDEKGLLAIIPPSLY